MIQDRDLGIVSRRHAVMLGGAAIGAFALSRSVQAQEATPQATPSDCVPTTPAENKAIVQQFFDAWASHDVDALAAVLAPSYVHHWGFSTDTEGADAMIERLSLFFDAFPDFSVTYDMMLAEDDLVAAHWVGTGTQSGEYQGVPPTTVTTTWTGLNIFRISCGMIVEGWNESDHLGRLIQAGIITDDELGSVGTPTP